ncbi:MAG: apolipoprotein N-acyltransferase [Candidatus Omnitrophica bacterium]|nr:apolipoprotein N-acyltransferase [Candidatus Omnitrophota bacterium]
MILLVLISAFLFYLSFPNFISIVGFSFLAWVFAIPFFICLENKKPLERLGIGFAFGFIANLLAVNWMIPYSGPGYFLLSFILAGQAVIFAILYRPLNNKTLLNILYVPSLWVASEYLRKSLMMGESWDLGHSQSFDIHLIQVANLFGSSGISFVLILINYVAYLVLFQSKDLRSKVSGLITMVVVLVMVYSYGFISLQAKDQSQASEFKICVLQPNIDYRGDLTKKRIVDIVDAYIVLTREAVKDTRLDLIVWPETAIPTDFMRDSALQKKIMSLVRDTRIPFLIGSIREDNNGLHNSAIFVDANGNIKQVYDKRHLIPLTEFIPDSLFWKKFAQIFDVDSPHLVAGVRAGMMDLQSQRQGDKIRFGVAICSEDNVSQVFRDYSQGGAGFVIVLLNNGWFSQKAGFVMHGQHSVIHSVENSIPTIRVANSGWSVLIDDAGRVPRDSLLTLQQKEFLYFNVTPNTRRSLYNIIGDTFCLLCVGFVIMFQFITRKFSIRKSG